MIAAIYARKSTEQTGMADEAKSVARQMDHARAYALAKGWTLDERYVFADDGISGAEFANRPGFLRLMTALKPRAPFQVLIMSEESRLGREAIETAYALKQLIQAGVRVFFYLEDRERTLNSPIEKAMLALQTMGDEMEREKARLRTTDAMDRKARAGHVTGGRTFGYDNLRISKGHVERTINEAEAAIVLRIYELAAIGHGSRHIAHVLNQQGVPTPRAQRGRPSGWDQGTIRAVLERSIYRGVIEYKKTKKRDSWGQKKITARPSSDLIRVERSELRIIPLAITDAVDEIRADRRQRYLRANDGRLLGRPTLGRYLLSGMLRCPCGANFEAQKTPHGIRKFEAYVCAAARRKGPSVCASKIALPIAETDDRVLAVIERDVLHPAFIDIVLQTVFTPETIDRSALEAEREDLERQMANLTTAVKAGGDIPALIAEIKSTNSRLADLRRRLEPAEQHDREQLRAALEHRVEEWKVVLRAHPAQARQVLHHLLGGPITLWPDLLAVMTEPGLEGFEDTAADGKQGITSEDVRAGLKGMDIRWSATTRPAGLLAGLIWSNGGTSPTGFEPVFWP
jgi:site-specific DNA recombinase